MCHQPVPGVFVCRTLPPCPALLCLGLDISHEERGWDTSKGRGPSFCFQLCAPSTRPVLRHGLGPAGPFLPLQEADEESPGGQGVLASLAANCRSSLFFPVADAHGIKQEWDHRGLGAGLPCARPLSLGCGPAHLRDPHPIPGSRSLLSNGRNGPLAEGSGVRDGRRRSRAVQSLGTKEGSGS